MRLELIDGIRLIIIAFLAYVPTVTLSGWFTAWVAKRCDDDLPERFGFLTLDPFAHFSFVWFALLLVGKLFGQYSTFLPELPGFGRFIFLEPSEGTPHWKINLSFFARPLAHFIMLTLALVVLAFMFARSYNIQTVGSLFASIKDVLMFFLEQNITLCFILFLISCVDAICFYMMIPKTFFERLGVLFFVLLTDFLLCLVIFGLKSSFVHTVLNIYIALFQKLLLGVVS